jgi:hypothetical protein
VTHAGKGATPIGSRWVVALSAATLGSLVTLTASVTACSTEPNGFAEPPPVGAIAGDGGGVACTGLTCQVQTCNGGAKTRVMGRVFDPSGTAPIYNAVVYIPNEAPAPVPRGAVCDRGADTVRNPVPRAVLTNENGEFAIDGAPSGDKIPLVFQIGKWRRQVEVSVTACADNTFEDPKLMHLPTKQSEGDMPQIAVVTGGCDPLGCLFSRMGIAASEFTDAKGPGKIHIYKGIGGEGVVGGTASAPEADLWNNVATLKKYDMVMLSCECKEHPENKPPSAKQAMMDYLDYGGRVFATHYHYEWLKNGPEKLAGLADWGISPASSLGLTYTVDQSFPKGQAMAEWLLKTGASTTKGEIDIKVPPEHLRGVKAGAQRWIYRGNGAEEMVKFFSFNAPVGAPPAQQCGRGVLSDLHVSDGDGVAPPPGAALPTSCAKGELTARERALEFLMFDLSSCVQPDSLAPVTPR